jgi:hypothetical protein
VFDGLQEVKTERVDLTDFFQERKDENGKKIETYVVIRKYTPKINADLGELLTKGVKVTTDKKTGLVTTDKALRADTLLQIRRLKVSTGVVDHNIFRGGKKVDLNDKVIDEIDEINSAVFDRVVDHLDKLNGAETAPMKVSELVAALRGDYEDSDEISLDEVAAIYEGSGNPT